MNRLQPSIRTALLPPLRSTADIIAATTEGGFTDSCSLTVVDSAVIDAPISDALNVSGGSLVFSNDTAHPWTVDSETFAGRTAAKSTINGMAGTSTGIRLNAGTLHAGDRLSFDWLASSEGGTWDYAAFIANGNVEATTGGTDNDWANFIYTVPADGEYIFEWTYQRTDHAIRAMTAFMLTRCAFFRLSAFWVMLTETEPLQYPMLS